MNTSTILRGGLILFCSAILAWEVFDAFDPDVGNDNDVTLAAYKAYAEALRKQGLISAEAAANRTLLLEIMDAVGLRPYVKEWWHFQERISMSATRERYKLLDF